ncbi:hypothetical protein JCM3766R1_001657 [Sporobolomyces carnicolor]
MGSEPLREAVETLRPHEAEADPDPLDLSRRLSHHPFSHPRERSYRRQDEQPEEEAEAQSQEPAQSIAAKVDLPSTPPSAFLVRHPPLVSSAAHHPLAPLPPIEDVSPSASYESPASLRFDPARDLAAAYALYPRQNLARPHLRDVHYTQSIITASSSRESHTLERDPNETENREPLRTRTRFSFSRRNGDGDDDDADAKQRLLEKRRGRTKLKWWSLFWLVVIGATALGIGIASTKPHKQNEPSSDTEPSRRVARSQDVVPTGSYLGAPFGYGARLHAAAMRGESTTSPSSPSRNSTSRDKRKARTDLRGQT